MNTEIYSARDSFGDAMLSREIAANCVHITFAGSLAETNPDWLDIACTRFDRAGHSASIFARTSDSHRKSERSNSLKQELHGEKLTARRLD
jgi:hypothetical protein